MKRSRFSEEQVSRALREVEAGVPGMCRLVEYAASVRPASTTMSSCLPAPTARHRAVRGRAGALVSGPETACARTHRAMLGIAAVAWRSPPRRSREPCHLGTARGGAQEWTRTASRSPEIRVDEFATDINTGLPCGSPLVNPGRLIARTSQVRAALVAIRVSGPPRTTILLDGRLPKATRPRAQPVFVV